MESALLCLPCSVLTLNQRGGGRAKGAHSPVVPQRGDICLWRPCAIEDAFSTLPGSLVSGVTNYSRPGRLLGQVPAGPGPGPGPCQPFSLQSCSMSCENSLVYERWLFRHSLHLGLCLCHVAKGDDSGFPSDVLAT